MVIAVTSGKGGTGQSCVAAYTGAAFATMGKRVIIVEMGGSARTVDLILGVQGEIVEDFSGVAKEEYAPERAIRKTSYSENLFLLPGPSVPFLHFPEISWYCTFLENLAKEYDIIILDGVDFHAFPPKLADTILLVITPESLAIRAAAMHSRGIYASGAENIRLVINSVSPRPVPMYGARDFDDVIDIIGVQLIAVVPESPMLKYCANNAQTVDEGSLTAEVFKNLSKRLTGEHPLLVVK